jgi:hypothetical protein
MMMKVMMTVMMMMKVMSLLNAVSVPYTFLIISFGFLPYHFQNHHKIDKYIPPRVKLSSSGCPNNCIQYLNDISFMQYNSVSI